jgi:hypothetical protein
VSFTLIGNDPIGLGSQEATVNRSDQFDRAYCHAVKSACLGAIAATSFSRSEDEDKPIPADEIKVALIDIMGTISAMVEQSLPSDLKAWAEELAAQFAASFHAARSSLSAEDLQSLQPSQVLN